MPSAARNIVIEVHSSSHCRCFSLVSSFFLLLPLPFGSCSSACLSRFASLRFVSSCASCPTVASPAALVTLALPVVPLSFLFYALACPHARLLCCCFYFYFPSPRDLPFPRPRYPLRTPASFPRPSDPRSSLFVRAIALALCLLPVPLVLCVCLLCCCPPVYHTPCSPLPHTRSRRSRGVPRVTPPHERAPLSSVIIPVGSVFSRKAAPSALECYIIRLPGFDEDQGTLQVGLVDASGHTEGTFASIVKRGHFIQPCSFESLPSRASFVLAQLLDCPPLSGRVSPRISSHLPSLLRTSSPLPLLAPLMVTPVMDLHLLLRSHSCDSASSSSLPSFSDLLSPLPADSHSGSRWSLLPSHREFKLLLVWKVPRLASPAFIIFSHLEGGVRRWLRRLHPTASPAKFRRLLESVAPPFGVLEPFLLDARFYCPTLSASRSGHPIRLCDLSFFTLRHLWTLFGFPLSDPLYSVLRYSFSAPQLCFLLCLSHVHFVL